MVIPATLDVGSRVSGVTWYEVHASRKADGMGTVVSYVSQYAEFGFVYSVCGHGISVTFCDVMCSNQRRLRVQYDCPIQETADTLVTFRSNTCSRPASIGNFVVVVEKPVDQIPLLSSS